MAALDHCCSLPAAAFPPSPCPLIVLLALCASPLPPAPREVGEAPGRRRVARAAAASAQGPAVGSPPPEPMVSASKGTALCPPTGAAPTVSSPSPEAERVIRTTARTSPSFTPLIPGLIAAGGIGITLVPQRPWVPHVPLRGPTTTTEPYFEEEEVESNVTGRVGSTAYLDCKIEMQQELVVTWLHRKDDSIQLLTVGRHPYSRDSRFVLSHQHPNNWRLQILSVMKNDGGLYECQIATHPIKVRKVFFQVTAPELKIVDEDYNELLERHYKAGSEVKLTCLATQLEEEDGLEGEAEGGGVRPEGGEGEAPHSATPPLPGGIASRVLWRHGDSTITHSTEGKVIRPKTSPDGRNVSVALTFHAIKAEDGGNYTCTLGDVSSAAVHIKIINGESNESNEDNYTKNRAVPVGIIKLCMVSNFIFLSLGILMYHIANNLFLSS